MTKIKFSIIVPLYNKEQFIKSTLKSIIYQNYDNYEVIIIDDCSTDKSYQMVTDLKNELNNNKVFLYKNLKNSGVSFSRNQGIEKASGDYVIFLDADDEFKDKNFLQNLDSYINKYNADYVMTVRNYYGKKLKPNFEKIAKYLTKIENDFYKINNNINLSLIGNFPFGGSASAIVSKQLIVNKKFDEQESRFEDWLFFFDLFINTDMAYLYKIDSIKINDDKKSLSKQKIKNVSMKCPKLYYYLDGEEKLIKLRKKFFWIWLTGEIRSSVDSNHLKSTFRIHRRKIISNIIINKYSLYCLSVNLLSVFLSRRNIK